MTKTVSKTMKRDLRRAFFTKEAAELAGVSQREAQYVVSMGRRNERVVTAYMMLLERFKEAAEEVREMLPHVSDVPPAPKGERENERF